MSRPRRSRLGLAVVLLAAGLGALELALRWSGVFEPVPVQVAREEGSDWAVILQVHEDERLGYVNVPSINEKVGGVFYRHDKRGRRVPAGPPLREDHGAPGVAFLGDSMTYGLGLNVGAGLLEQTTNRLGGAIRPINLGVCGYDTVQELALYEAEREQLPGVELLVLVVFANDFKPVPTLWDETLGILYYDPLPLPRSVRRVLWNSALYRAVVHTAMQVRDALEDESVAVPSSFEDVRRSITRLKELVAEDGRQLLVAHLPAMALLDPYAFHLSEAALRAHCEQEGIAYVDLLDGFLAERERHLQHYELLRGTPLDAPTSRAILSMYWLNYPTDQHLNVDGNRVASAPLADAIQRVLGL